MLLASLSLAAQNTELKVTVTNDWDQAKKDEPVVVDLRPFRKDDVYAAARVTTQGGNVIASQLDDMDGDCIPDELVFLTDIAADSQQTFTVTLTTDTANVPQYPARVYAYMGLNDKYGKQPEINSFEVPGSAYVFKDIFPHGAEFENEFTAWRVYADSRQNIDLYGKRKHQLELATTHFYSVKEHLDKGYGNDVLWAGGSVGCGTLREWAGGPQELTDVHLRGQKILAYGPLRTVVELRDFGWRGDNARTYYILYAGHRELFINATFDRPLDNTYFCTGVQKVGHKTEFASEARGEIRPNGIACSWGKDYPDYGKKDLYKPEAVGLAVFVPQEYIYNSVEDDLNYLFVLQANAKRDFHYWVSYCADMEEENGFHSADEWFASLDDWKSYLEHPVHVKIKKK